MATVSTTRPRLSIDGPKPSPRKKLVTPGFINSLQSPDRTPSTTASTPSPSSSLLQGEFYAIRKGKGVKCCIFATWDHAKEHLDKNAVYNVFDKIDDAVLYVRTAPKTTSGSIKPPQKRKRTAVLPCSSSNSNSMAPPITVASKKPRTVSIVQLPSSSASASASENKENQASDPSMPSRQAQVPVNVSAKEQEADEDTNEDDRPLPKILEEGYKNSYVKGWRANQLFPAKKQCRDAWERRYLSDVAELKHFRQNQSKNSSVRDVHKMNHCSGIPNAFSLAYLNWSWGVGEAYHRYLAFQQRKQKPTGSRQRMKNNKMKSTPANRSNHYSCSTCVITNREAARKRFTAKAMFYSFRVQQLAEMSTTNLTKNQLPNRPDPTQMHNQSPLVNGCSRSKGWMDEARRDWDEKLSASDHQYWEEQERLHDERQPEILKILEESLAQDPKRSAKKLSEDINFWCGKTTIGKWKNLRIGPSYRKGIANPGEALHMSANSAGGPLAPITNTIGNSNQSSQPQRKSLAVVLPEVSEPSESTEDPYSGDEYEENPYPSSCISSKKAEMELEKHIAEEDLVI